jgi:hypothetical protein
MNALQLFLLLRRHVKLSERRHVLFESNQYGKFFGYILVAIVAIELIAVGTFLGWTAAREDLTELVFYLMPFLLIFDFAGRFATQQTPQMLVKPYLLTPVSKYSAVDCFLILQLLSSGNLLWMALFLPYAFIVWCGGLSLWAAFAMLLLLHLMVLVNSQWYLLVRTLVNQHLLWWLLPVAVYVLPWAPLLFLPETMSDQILDAATDLLDGWLFSWAAFGCYVLLLLLLFAINRRTQMHFIYDEIGHKGTSSLKTVSDFHVLNRFGQIGEYLKLEIKSTMRNKAIRSRFIQGVCFITFFSLMIAFGNVYRSSFERNFWCLYAFIFFGSVNLTKVMCPEGNYIDLLMVHQENTLTLLRAKYYFYCAILLLPLLLQLPPVIMGQFSILMIVAYLLTATGPVYFLLFQMAVYNKTTLPLNSRITGKNQTENKWQAIVSMIAFFAPVILVMLLQTLFSPDTAYWLLIAIGLAFTLSEPWWMRHIYRRMMLRRYDNLEGFRTTR